jgi:hypothetical protein
MAQRRAGAGTHQREARRGLAAAEVGEGPDGVAHHRDLWSTLDQLQDRLERARHQHHVAQLRTVARNVAERPDRLLAHVLGGVAEEADEGGDAVGLDDALGLLRRARRDVGQAPLRLELQLGRRVDRE